MNAIVIIISSIAVMAYIIAEYRDIRKNKQEELNKIQQERKTQQDYFNSTRMVLKMYKLSEQTHPDIDELKTVIKYHYTCNYDEMLRKACHTTRSDNDARAIISYRKPTMGKTVYSKSY